MRYEEQELEFLAFEKPIAELEAKINELKHATTGTEVNIAEEIKTLKEKSNQLAANIFKKLKPDQVVQVARHPNRPHFRDYAAMLFDDFTELHGDRTMADGQAILGGIAQFKEKPVMIIGHQKGRETKEKLTHNFGMPRPEGYRKALRLMKLAEKFRMPIITFIDTPGAYPGIDAEERNQSGAIATNIFEMSQLRTPIISIVVGEGGSGGALAIGVSDVTLMLQYSVYSVISPEGCATILWKSATKAGEAAQALGLTAQKILEIGLIEGIIPEPIGGAHRNYPEIMSNISMTLQQHLHELQAINMDSLLEKRYQKLMLKHVDTGA